MINAVHTVIYTTNAEADRAFFSDVLNLPKVDAGGGWLIFALPPGELGVHPIDSAKENGRHQLYLTCDDLENTMAELKAKGVKFTQAVSEQRWGRLTAFELPGGSELYLYQPKHASPRR